MHVARQQLNKNTHKATATHMHTQKSPQFKSWIKVNEIVWPDCGSDAKRSLDESKAML